MAAENGESADGEIEPEPTETAIVDDENYSHSRRQQSIEDSRERAIDVRTEARGQMVSGQLGELKARQYYRGAVESYLLEVIPVLQQDEIDLEKDYLQEVKLGEITFEPPSELVTYAEENIIRLAPGSQVPTARTVEVRGLEEVLSLPSPLSQTWSVIVEQSGGPNREVARTVRELPLSVLDEIMQTTDEALNQLDIGMKVDEKEQQTKITDDLLREVDEWRQQNVE